jgi:rod shape determining protein RodA|tara:strand:- start:1932 stop:3056 length:1125 start_codon:yes stop_codon:yes gene_type:complete
MFKQGSIHSHLSLRDKIFSLDLVLVSCILILGIISFFAMYSTDGGEFAYHTKSHIVRFFVFFFLFIIVSFFKANFWYTWSTGIYLAFLTLLVLVQLFGLTASGSQRWLNLYFLNIQPSELMKIGLILFLAKYYHRISSGDVNRFKFLLSPIIALMLPVFMVLTQPDLGTAFLIGAGGIVVIWLAGVQMKYFAYLGGIFLAITPIAISFLKPYQKSRILTFLDPTRDPLGAGYQITQSKIAIGSGGLFGKGFLNGSQSYLDYLPEKHTDFIFTLFSEEFGFFGSCIVLLLYILITWRIVSIGNMLRDTFGKLFCYSFATAFFLYVAVNMGMVLGLIPIVGAPLPILSYGGSSMMAMMFGLGIVMSCRIHKDEHIG